MVGRPRKYDYQDPAIRLTVYIPASLRYKIPKNINLTEYITGILQRSFEDPIRVELAELEKKEQELKEELSVVQNKIIKLRKEIEERERLRKEIEARNMYAVFEFWQILKVSAKNHKLNFEGTIYPEKILGIKFDYKEVSKALEEKEITQDDIETFEQIIQIAKKYNVRYIGQGEREKEEFEKFMKFYDNYKKIIVGSEK